MISPQDRINERVNRARLALEARRGFGPLLVVAVAAVVALFGFNYLRDQLGAGTGASRSVRFAVKDANSIVEGSTELRLRGVKVGTLSKVEIDDGRAVVTASMLEKYGEIYRDARATIRPNTPLRDMYLDVLDRGSKAAGTLDGEPLAAAQTDIHAHVADVLSAFQPDTRARLRVMLGELGEGLDDRGAMLRQLFVEYAPLVDVLGKLSRELATRKTRTRRLVRNVSSLTEVLGQRDRTLRRLIADADTVFAATTDERAGLDGTLRELPLALRELDTSLTTVHAALPDVDGGLRALGPVANALPVGLDAIRAISADAKPAVRALRPPLARLVPFSRQLRETSRSLAQAVTALRPQTGELDTISKDLAGCPIVAYTFFQWTASVFKWDDALGAYPRGDFGFGTDNTGFAEDSGSMISPSCARGTPKGGQP